MDAGHLKQGRYDLTKEIVYHKQCIRAFGTDSVDRDQVPDISKSLFDRGQVLDLGAPCQDWHEMPCDPINLHVPLPFPEQRYPELIFGVATSFDRLIDSVPQFAHWLSGSGSLLVAVVVDAAAHNEDFERLTSLFNNHNIDLVIGRSWNGLGVNEQHFTVIRDIIKYITTETKWIGIIDDDTFFPSLYPLSEVLATQDHMVPAYLGGLSDSLYAIQNHGLMAYGGAGAFLSVPLAKQLEPSIEKCLEESNTAQGDALLKNCIYSQTKTRLTLVPGLNQLDIMGNPDGFYESGRLPLSLHHWKSWHHAPVDMMAKASDFCGDCLLQRWRLGSDTVIANGYSIAVYNDGIEQSDLNRTEGTFDYTHLFDWSLGPFRDKAQEGHKRSYHLIDAEILGNSLRQVYVHRSRDDQPSQRLTNQGVIVPDPEYIRDEVVELWWDR